MVLDSAVQHQELSRLQVLVSQQAAEIARLRGLLADTRRSNSTQESCCSSTSSCTLQQRNPFPGPPAKLLNLDDICLPCASPSKDLEMSSQPRSKLRTLNMKTLIDGAEQHGYALTLGLFASGFVNNAAAVACDYMGHQGKVVWVSSKFLELLDAPNMDAGVAVMNSGKSLNLAMRLALLAWSKTLLLSDDPQPVMFRNVLYRSNAPAQLVCTWRYPVLFQDDDATISLAWLTFNDPNHSAERLYEGCLREHMVLKYSPSMVTMTDEDGRIWVQNATSYASLGFQGKDHRLADSMSPEFQANYILELLNHDADAYSDMLQCTQQALSYSKIVQIHSSLLKRWLGCEERDVWHEVQVTALKDPVTRQPGFVVSQVDVTAAVSDQLALASLRRQQEQLLKEILPAQVVATLLNTNEVSEAEEGAAEDLCGDEGGDYQPSRLSASASWAQHNGCNTPSSCQLEMPAPIDHTSKNADRVGSSSAVEAAVLNGEGGVSFVPPPDMDGTYHAWRPTALPAWGIPADNSAPPTSKERSTASGLTSGLSAASQPSLLDPQQQSRHSPGLPKSNSMPTDQHPAATQAAGFISHLGHLAPRAEQGITFASHRMPHKHKSTLGAPPMKPPSFAFSPTPSTSSTSPSQHKTSSSSVRQAVHPMRTSTGGIHCASWEVLPTYEPGGSQPDRTKSSPSSRPLTLPPTLQRRLRTAPQVALSSMPLQAAASPAEQDLNMSLTEGQARVSQHAQQLMRRTSIDSWNASGDLDAGISSRFRLASGAQRRSDDVRPASRTSQHSSAEMRSSADMRSSQEASPRHSPQHQNGPILRMQLASLSQQQVYDVPALLSPSPALLTTIMSRQLLDEQKGDISADDISRSLSQPLSACQNDSQSITDYLFDLPCPHEPLKGFVHSAPNSNDDGDTSQATASGAANPFIVSNHVSLDGSLASTSHPHSRPCSAQGYLEITWPCQGQQSVQPRGQPAATGLGRHLGSMSVRKNSTFVQGDTQDQPGNQDGGMQEDCGSGDGGSGPYLTQRDVMALATYHDQATVLFADIKGFTAMCADIHPAQVMLFLNSLYNAFDALCEVHDVYKVETIGDCYMVAGGLFKPLPEGSTATRRLGGVDPDHAQKVVNMARAMVAAAAHIQTPLGDPVELRVGIHSGSVCSGVVGRRCPRFCLFGATVNCASRMESTGKPGLIHVSQATRDLTSHESWDATPGVFAKGFGVVQTYILRTSAHMCAAHVEPHALQAGAVVH